MPGVTDRPLVGAGVRVRNFFIFQTQVLDALYLPDKKTTHDTLRFANSKTYCQIWREKIGLIYALRIFHQLRLQGFVFHLLLIMDRLLYIEEYA